MSGLAPAHALTVDFFDTLVFHRDGRGRGRVLVEYLEDQGFEPAVWEHDVLYDIFAEHDAAYSPLAPEAESARYLEGVAARVFERFGIAVGRDETRRHAPTLWEILGPAAFEVFADVREVLGALRRGGVPIAIVSNWQCGLRHYCHELGIADCVDHIVGSADFGAAKPDERIFWEACSRLGSAPSNTLHVGDTYVDDYEGGTAAGLQVALLARRREPDPRAARVVRDLAGVRAFVHRP